MQTVPNFERIGDYATNLVELAEKLQSESTSFSETAKKELALITGAEELLATLQKADVFDEEMQKEILYAAGDIIVEELQNAVRASGFRTNFSRPCMRGGLWAMWG